MLKTLFWADKATGTVKFWQCFATAEAAKTDIARKVEKTIVASVQRWSSK